MNAFFSSNVVGTQSIETLTLPWQPSKTQGFETLRLYEDIGTGDLTALMRLAPGASSPMHMHETLEELYVLEGDLRDNERIYQLGTYIVRSPGTLHTAATVDGCVVMLIFRGRAAGTTKLSKIRHASE
jgi:anti-sigma factor ChrR (cupin superfamily)